MYAGRIPDWDGEGVIPPMDPRDPTSFDRSPYKATLIDVAAKFGGSEGRRRLLSGLLDFRAVLHAAGLVRGFQWVNGSFVENVESSQGRAPGDIDVVTFFYVPEGHTEESVARGFPELFEPSALKRIFGVDAYPVAIDLNNVKMIVDHATYWYSLWGHTREGLWKGFVEVDLDPGEDESARAALVDMNDEDGGLM